MSASADRVDPPNAADERATLRGFLDYHRATLLMKCEGLDTAGLAARPVSTSPLSLHGLVRHMAEVERGWFRRRIEGVTDHAVAGPIWCDESDPDRDFNDADGLSFAADLAVFRAEVDHAREVEARFALDHVTEGPGGDSPGFSVRWILVHMVEEYARHNGHADLIREMVDGATGE